MRKKTIRLPSYLKANVLTARSSCLNLHGSLMPHSSMTSTITSGVKAFAIQNWAHWLLNTMLLNWWMFILTSLALKSLLRAHLKSTGSASGSATIFRRRTLTLAITSSAHVHSCSSTSLLQFLRTMKTRNRAGAILLAT